LAGTGSLLFDLAKTGQVFEVETDTILPIPEMPEAVIGIHRLRERALWLIDLGLLFGIQSEDLNRPQAFLTILTVQGSGGRQLGIVVDQLEDIVGGDPLQWLPFQDRDPTLRNSLDPFVQGWWKTSTGLIPVLDPEALFEALAAP
jgi:chemotaxis signal transduction protein